MTTVRAQVAAPLSLGPLGEGDRGELQRLVDADAIGNAVLASRLAAIGSLAPVRLGGMLIGVREGTGTPATPAELVGAVFNGGNLLPVGGRPEVWRALAAHCARRPRLATSVVGRADAVASMWPVLERSWGPAREVRPDQPLLVTDRRPPAAIDRHPGLRTARPDEIEAYLPAAAAMFTEELGISPTAGGAAQAYRRRIAGLLRDERAYAVTDSSGSVVFKADIGALTPHTCQLQGVWVRRDHRGRGLGTAALAAVLDDALALAPTVSLYVNAFNTPARRMYDRLGMRQQGSLATVLF